VEAESPEFIPDLPEYYAFYMRVFITFQERRTVLGRPFFPKPFLFGAGEKHH